VLTDSQCRAPTAISGSCLEGKKKYLGNKMFCTVWLKLKTNPTTSSLKAETNCEKSYPIDTCLMKDKRYEK